MLRDILLGVLTFLLIIYGIVLLKNKKANNQEDSVVIILTIVIISLSYLTYMIFKYTKKKETFSNPAPLDYKIGDLSGLYLAAGDKLSYNNLTPDELLKISDLNLDTGDKLSYNNLTAAELIEKQKMIYYSPVGSAHILNPDPHANKHYPSVDGKVNSPKSLFMFAYNQSSPECCPSSYSSDRGCVCLSEDQKDFLNKGGIVK